MATSTAHYSILVGVDGSPQSKAAVDWAARAAALRKVPLTLVHVISLPRVDMWPEMPAPPESVQWYEQNGDKILLDAAKAVEATWGPNAIQLSSEILSGAALPGLISLSKDADMIVVGCRGLGAIARRLMGSVSWGLVHHAHCPVAVVHTEDPVMSYATEAPVVVGIDGSPASESATAIAFDEASRRRVELVAVHAWSDYGLPGGWLLKQEDAEEVLAERIAGWQEKYPDVQVRRVVVRDRPAHELLMLSEAAQLVVMGSHGRGGFAGMLLGSVSSAVAEAARIPVIVARSS
ncbi:MAG TPA: universal stress protein [Mycobacterium sp.]|jgi:nucleotide-binding universal stress UspA family protein